MADPRSPVQLRVSSRSMAALTCAAAACGGLYLAYRSSRACGHASKPASQPQAEPPAWLHGSSEHAPGGSPGEDERKQSDSVLASPPPRPTPKAGRRARRRKRRGGSDKNKSSQPRHAVSTRLDLDGQRSHPPAGRRSSCTRASAPGGGPPRRQRLALEYAGRRITVDLSKARAAAAAGLGAEIDLHDVVRGALGLGTESEPVLTNKDGRELRLGFLTPAGEYKIKAPAPPTVTAKAWIVCDAESGAVLASHQPHTRLQPASITKVATALVVFRQWDKDPSTLDQLVTVSHFAASCKSGTHARLKAGDMFTVRDMLYALMLPSGNDAAVVLAEHFGSNFEPPASSRVLTSGEYYQAEWKATSPVGRFVAEMNREAACCGATGTSFVSPHGMGHAENLTTASDLLKLVQAAMAYDEFATIVKSREYVGQGKAKRFRRIVDVRKYRWTNTNGLLDSADDTFDGVKTGWVPNAHGQRIHACLASSVRNPARSPGRLFVVVIGSVNKPMRFVDTQRLVSWAWDRLNAVRRPSSRGSGNAGSGAPAGAGGSGAGSDVGRGEAVRDGRSRSAGRAWNWTGEGGYPVCPAEMARLDVLAQSLGVVREEEEESDDLSGSESDSHSELDERAAASGGLEDPSPR